MNTKCVKTHIHVYHVSELSRVMYTRVAEKCAKDSPSSCKITEISVPGYSAGGLLRVSGGKRIHRSTDANSCPSGWKIWSPRNKKDWTIVYNALAQRSFGYPANPYLIVDVTRNDNGCGGCTSHAMNSNVPQQSGWRTTDGSDWWLRDSSYFDPNGNYRANCYLWVHGFSPDNVRFNDHYCHYYAYDYLCQPSAGSGPKLGL